MARVQADYDPRAEALQTTAAPNILAEQARFDPNANKAFQLAAALGAPSVQQGLATMNAQIDENNKKKAERDFRDLPMSEINKLMEDGRLMPSSNPIYVATLQHLWGERQRSDLERNMLSQMSRGELKFEGPDAAKQMEEYLYKQREAILKGKSQYAAAGFDKGMDKFRESLSNSIVQHNDARVVAEGTAEATDNLGITYENSAGKPPAERAKDVLDKYEFLKSTKTLPDEKRKEALQNALTTIAGRGDLATFDELVKSKLDNGLTVGAVLGTTKIETLRTHANTAFDKEQRQRVDVEMRPFYDKALRGELNQEEWRDFVKKNEKYITTQTTIAVEHTNMSALQQQQKDLQKAQMLAEAERTQAAAQQNVEQAVKEGNLAFLPEQQVMTPNGETKSFNNKQAAEKVIQQTIQQQQMPFQQQVMFWSTNGLTNPEWEKSVQSGVGNIASIGWAYDGKNVGKLNPQGEAALKQYIAIADVNPEMAKKYAGSKEDQRMLDDIYFLYRHGGFPNLSDAATMVNQSRHRGISAGDVDLKRNEVKSAVDAIVYPHFWSSFTSWAGSLFNGNKDVNLQAIQSDIRRRATLLVESGHYSDAKTAVEATIKYYSDGAVTTKINNTLYLNSDLPTVPPGGAEKWMERFINEKVAKDYQGAGATDTTKLFKEPGLLGTGFVMDLGIAAANGGSTEVRSTTDVPANRIRLEPNVNGTYTAYQNNVPLQGKDGNILTYSRTDVEKWMGATHKADLDRAIVDKNDNDSFEKWSKKARLNFYKENKVNPKEVLPGFGQATMNQYMTLEGYRILRAQNALDRPYKEQIEIVKKFQKR